jgi:hypothetical protein
MPNMQEEEILKFWIGEQHCEERSVLFFAYAIEKVCNPRHARLLLHTDAQVRKAIPVQLLCLDTHKAGLQILWRQDTHD